MKNIGKYILEKLIISKNMKLEKSIVEKISIIRDTIKKIIKSLNYSESSFDTVLIDNEGFSTSNYSEVRRLTLQFKGVLSDDTEKLKEIKNLLQKELPQYAYSKIETSTNTITNKTKYIIYL